jgi:hypothetical protein
MSESQIYGIFRKPELVKTDLFGALTEEDELKIEENWSAKASAINCGSVIMLSPT